MDSDSTLLKSIFDIYIIFEDTGIVTIMLPRDCTNLKRLHVDGRSATIVEHPDPVRYNGLKYPFLEDVNNISGYFQLNN